MSEFQKNDVSVKVEHSGKIWFAMQQYGADIIRSVTVRNNSKDEMRGVRVKISSSPQFFEDIYLNAGTLAAGREYQFKDIKPSLDFDCLSGVTEKVRAEITAETEIEETPVGSAVSRIDMLAFDEWPGCGLLPELLAAFCLPRDPAVSLIVSEAAQLLKKEGLNFDGYRSGDVNTANRQLAAIWSVIKSKNIAYCTPPASFEKEGQKIRLPQAVVNLGLGTCLDTTMLFCSCAEAAGLNPIVFIFNGHAFPGFWLADESFPECINDDLSGVKKLMASGISRLTAFESTLVTDKDGGFEQARKAAKARLDDGAGFILYLDIARARKAGILPLPLRYEPDGRCFADRRIYEAEVKAVEKLRAVEADLQEQALGGRLEKWKRDLLDITLRNPLINYRINKTGAPLLNFDLEAVEGAFTEGKTLTIAARPKEMPAVSDITKLNAENDEQLTAVLKNELAAGRLRSALAEDDLEKKMTALFRSARLSIEETGANTLYLALGFLKWQERDKPATDRYSPVILLPVELTRRSARSGFVLRMTDEEIQVNLSLLEMLRVNYKIDASALKNPPLGERGVDITAALTYLRKRIMGEKGWDVIEAAALGLFQFSSFVLWNDLTAREKRVRKHPLTASLISGKTDPRLFNAAGESGDGVLYLPLSSDSSQTAAAAEAAAGKSFVLHGPPGTGKSQTITNIIGNALAHGKRVLFVAEKQAALNVVKKRLEKLGLFDFCLELHSNKCQKKDFYEQFDKVAELAESAKDVNYAEAERKLSGAAAELEAFSTAMHKIRGIGCSAYTGINRAIAAGRGEAADGGGCTMKHTDITEKQYQDGLETLKNLAAMGTALGEPVNSAFYGCAVSEYSFALRDAVAKNAREIIAAQAGFAAAAEGLKAKIQRNKKPYDFAKYETISGVYACMKDALYYSQKGGFARFMSSVFGKRFHAMTKRPYYRKIKALIKETPDAAAVMFAGLEAFVAPESGLCAALRYGDKFAGAEDWAFEIYNAAEGFIQNLASLKDFCIYNSYLEKCAGFPQLAESVGACHGGAVQCAEALPLFEKSFWQSWVFDTVSADPVLNGFSPSEFAAKRERYRAFTEFAAGLTAKEIYLKTAANLPNFKFASMSSSEPGILLKAVKSRGRGTTIRQLFEKVPALMSKVKPCLLMSPLSAAQYLPPDYPEFDLVVFDEASQLLTCQAAGAACRGKGAVVVGDPNQLPPTTFFMAKQDEDGADTGEQDLESILDDMLALGVPQNKLLWHYRSEHESLIAFSNANYYDNKLITFPSPDDDKTRVEFRKVEGVYDRGGARTNPKEAEAVVSELFNCLNDPERSKLTYGIVTFNISQQTLIEDLIDKRIAKQPALDKFFQGDDGVFVKNIENVQGDERDVIFFSVTYGEDREGKMTVNFGPVNKDGGWRRLNVAVTRACKKIMVFSTITPDKIDLSRTASKGVRGLKDFMAYAQNGRLYLSKEAGAEADAAFVSSLAGALKKAGYKSSVNLGRSGNKIDVAVAGDGGYVLGIICDGENAASDFVRDREYGRDNVLRRMGWRLTRVYALEWWQNPQEELKRLLHILEGGGDEAQETAAADGAAAGDEIKQTCREIAYNPAIPLPVADYKTAELPVKEQEGFYLYNNAAVITAQIKRIIETEGPVPEQSVCKKIAAAWSIPRMTQKYTEYLGQLLKRFNPVFNMTGNAKFLWKDKNFEMIRFRDNSEVGRRAEEICKEEYAVAAYYVMRNALSIGADDLIRETARLFGFTKTAGAAMRINYALSLLVIAGKIVKDGDIYKIK